MMDERHLHAQLIKQNRSRHINEINITPLVDVMLVLLVIFMITAPLMTVAVPVSLPQTKATTVSEQTEPLVVTIKTGGDLYIQETKIPADQFAQRLAAVTQNKKETKVFVRADKNLNYGVVMEVMGLVSDAGFQKVSLVTEQP